MSAITDFSFPEMFASLNTGRDSSDRVLKTIIEGLLVGRFQPGQRVVARQLAEELGVGFAARRINRQEDSVAKLNDAMELVRENAGALEPFQYLMVLLRYHMSVHDVAEMPQLNEASRRLGFFFWAIFFPAYIPVREYGEMYIRNHQRETDAIVNGDPVTAEAAYQYHIDWTVALIEGQRPDMSQPWIRGS